MLRRTLAIAAFTLLVAPLCASAATIENLQVAYNAEMNEHARYLAYAAQADEDRYPSVASLFRAAARAEEIHANNHADAIRQLGAEPVAKIETPVVKATAENLETAIHGELYERDVMYPEFLRNARQENAPSATIRTLSYALAAERTHAELFADALRNLPRLKGVLGTYYVCDSCGYVTTNLRFEDCPSCADPKHDYSAVH